MKLRWVRSPITAAGNPQHQNSGLNIQDEVLDIGGAGTRLNEARYASLVNAPHATENFGGGIVGGNSGPGPVLRTSTSGGVVGPGGGGAISDERYERSRAVSPGWRNS